MRVENWMSSIFASLMAVSFAGQAAAQRVPTPPSFPDEATLLPGDVSLLPAPTRPQPKAVAADATRSLSPQLAEQVRPISEAAANPNSKDLPNQRELVSILKRKLPAENDTFEVKDAPEWFQKMMQRIVRENIPQMYVQDKDWNKTDRRWDGIEVERRGLLRWHTERKWKEVKDGTWKRYEVTQIDPDKNLKLRIENVRDAGDSKVGFELSLASRMHVFARTEKWAKGVQIYSLSGDADADIEMRVWCEVGMKLEILKFPPDVLLVPQVTKAELDVGRFELQKVSKLDGPLVKKMSGNVHRVLLDKIAEKRDRLPEKINRQIAKNKDDMRLSLADFASSKWETLTTGNDVKTSPSLAPKSESASDKRATRERQGTSRR